MKSGVTHKPFSQKPTPEPVMRQIHNHGSGVLHFPGFVLTFWQICTMVHVASFYLGLFS